MFDEAKNTGQPHPCDPKPSTDGHAMRLMSSTELQQMEAKCAEELRVRLSGFLYFPTLEAFQGIQEASGRYMTAWMHGRKRVIQD